MKNGSSIIFSKNLKIWKLYVTNKIALVKDEDFPFLNQIPFFLQPKFVGWSPTLLVDILHYFYGGLWLLCDWTGSHLDFYNVNTSSF